MPVELSSVEMGSWKEVFGLRASSLGFVYDLSGFGVLK